MRIPMISCLQPRRLLGMVFVVSVALASQPLKAAEPLTLLLRWDHQFQFAGYYAALWKGFYSDAGLEVTLRPPFKEGGGIVNSVDEVVSGRADFGIGAADLLVARDKGKPVVVLSTYFQESAAEYYINRKSGYSSLADLPRLHVARRIGDLLDVEFQAMLMAEGFNPDTLKPFQSFGSEQGLADGSLDLSPGYSFVTPYILKELGVDFITLRPRDYGVLFYGDSLFTREDLIDSKEDTVNKFVTASQRGWQYALDNPEEIADLIATKLKRRLPVTDPVAFHRAQIKGVRKVTLYPLVEPGHINPGRWQHMHDWLQKIGLVTKPIDLDLFILNFKKRELDRKNFLINLMLVLIGLGAASGVVLWIIILRRSVEARTAELHEAQEELLRKSRLAALGQLTATVSHELRNPLGALRTSIAAIRKLTPDGQEMMQRCTAIADRSVTRCDEIISDLLEYSRVRPLNRTKVALDDWLPAILDEIELPTGVELARSLDCGLELPLDPERLRRVVLNLVDNACQAMTAGDEEEDENEARERRLAVSTRATDARVELCIADTGPGMDAKALAKIFEPLYSTKVFGVGLGLTVVKQIIEQHGGGVEVVSTPGQGTEVVLWLPLPEPARKAAS